MQSVEQTKLMKTLKHQLFTSLYKTMYKKCTTKKALNAVTSAFRAFTCTPKLSFGNVILYVSVFIMLFFLLLFCKVHKL